jgi:hypothetical protein
MRRLSRVSEISDIEWCRFRNPEPIRNYEPKPQPRILGKRHCGSSKYYTPWTESIDFLSATHYEYTFVGSCQATTPTYVKFTSCPSFSSQANRNILRQMQVAQTEMSPSHPKRQWRCNRRAMYILCQAQRSLHHHATTKDKNIR